MSSRLTSMIKYLLDSRAMPLNSRDDDYLHRGLDFNQESNLPFSLMPLDRVLVLAFPAPQLFLSWSLTTPGFQIRNRVAWVELRNAELAENVDAEAVVRARLKLADCNDALALVTARDVRRHHASVAESEGTTACCFTTVGLANGERIGARFAAPAHRLGTVNTLVHISRRLTEAAYIELISIVATARTAAIMDAGVMRDGVAINGTGTDCIAVAAPVCGEARRFAGLHTAIGEAAGRAVYQATRAGIDVWQGDYDAFLHQRANHSSQLRD